MIAKVVTVVLGVFYSIGLFLICLYFTCPAFANYGSTLCKSSAEYHCYRIKHNETWAKLFPDGNERDLVMRINRMNTKLYPDLTIAIPNSDDTNIMDYSPLPIHIDPPGADAPGDQLIYISLQKQAFGAYNSDGNLVYWGPVSGARGYCPDIHRGCHTPLGHFSILWKEGPGCISSKYPVGEGGSPMPYCMHFHGGYALHGSYEVPGYNASHGCVRMFVNDARWLNQEFTEDGNTIVIINP